MLKRLNNWLYQKSGISLNDCPLKESEEVLYAAGLLIKLAEADGYSSPEESAEIIRILSNRDPGLASEAIGVLQSGFEKTEAVALTELLELLDDLLSLSQKQELLEWVYLVAKADSITEMRELEFVSKVVSLLHIPENVCVEAYTSALQKRAKD